MVINEQLSFLSLEVVEEKSICSMVKIHKTVYCAPYSRLCKAGCTIHENFMLNYICLYTYFFCQHHLLLAISCKGTVCNLFV